MSVYVDNLEEVTLSNLNYRQVLFTAKHSQLVVMNLKPLEQIGQEIHDDVDQFIRIEKGQGIAILNGKTYKLQDGSAVVIPAGISHNIINTQNSRPMKLYTIYTPPHHPEGTIQETNPNVGINQ